MAILYLNLKKKWFDMIASGEKTTEYRDVKPYWEIRLSKFLNEFKNDHNTVIFSNGYSKDRRQMGVELEGIGYGTGRKDWGAKEGFSYYKIRLGEILYKNF